MEHHPDPADLLVTEQRPEDDRANGVLRIILGGRPVELPVLRIRQSRAWRERFAAMAETDGEGATDIGLPIEGMLDLLAAYDMGGILGGREAIEDRATDREVYDAFEQIVAASYPFADARVMTQVAAGAFSRQAQPTNGRSRTGASRPMTSRTGSRTSSSSTSGMQGRSA